ncbi:MAG: hypothetical protein ACRD9L_19670 [Bryobacteraceae bacterium]
MTKEGYLIDLGVSNNFYEKKGSRYGYKGERIGQGRENARQFLRDNPDTRAKVDAELRQILGLVKKVEEPAAVPVPAPEPARAAARK